MSTTIATIQSKHDNIQIFFNFSFIVVIILTKVYCMLFSLKDTKAAITWCIKCAYGFFISHPFLDET